MKIEFRLFDKRDHTFKKVYFSKWNGDAPVFTKNHKAAKYYFNERLANKDILLLNKAESQEAITLSIKLRKE